MPGPAPSEPDCNLTRYLLHSRLLACGLNLEAVNRRAAGRPTCVSASPSQHPGGRIGLHMAEHQGGPLAQIIPDAFTSHRLLSEAPAEVGAGPHLDPGFADRLRELTTAGERHVPAAHKSRIQS